MTDRKRRIDLVSNVSDSEEAKSKKAKDINPWTQKPYSSKYHKILEGRLKLPVYQFKEKLLDAVAKNQIVVVEGT